MGIEDLRIEDDHYTTSMISIFANPGAGKTVLSAQLAPKSVLLTNENGYIVLKENHPELYKRVIPVRFKNLGSIATAINTIRAEPDASEYQLVLDTLTGMQALKIRENLKDPNVKINRFHPDIPSEQDYLLSQQQWTPIISNLATCGVNVTILTHLRTPPIPTPGRPVKGETTRPDLTKAVFNLVNQYSNMVAYLEKSADGTKRYVTTQGTAMLTAKDQLSVEEKNIPDDVFVQRILKRRGYGS